MTSAEDVLAGLMAWFIAARSGASEGLYATARFLGVPLSVWARAGEVLDAAEFMSVPRGLDAAFEIAIASVERRQAIEAARERVLSEARSVADRSVDELNGSMSCDDTLELWEAVDALRDAEVPHD